MRAVLAAVLAVLLLPAAAHAERYGTSADGRALTVERVGDPAAPVRGARVGSIHGTETAGHAVIARLRARDAAGGRPAAGSCAPPTPTASPPARARTPAASTSTATSRTAGAAAGAPFDTYFPGRRPASEPETRALQRLVRRERPALTISYHQRCALVDLPGAGDRSLVRAYARRVGLPARRLPPYRGTATAWQNHRVPGDDRVRRRAAAGRAVRRAPPRATPARCSRSPRTRARRARRPPPKPPIVGDPIPFGARPEPPDAALLDRATTATAKAKLRRPEGDRRALHGSRQLQLRVEHVRVATRRTSSSASGPASARTSSSTATARSTSSSRSSGAAATRSASTRPRSGSSTSGSPTPTSWAARAQLAASLALTRWLQARYGIRTRDVIGHAESLSSPYHQELVPAMRNRTHGDFARATMKRYRRKL